jgi:hypothetical protein
VKIRNKEVTYSMELKIVRSKAMKEPKKGWPER